VIERGFGVFDYARAIFDPWWWMALGLRVFVRFFLKVRRSLIDVE